MAVKLTPMITEEIQLKLIGCVFWGNPFHAAREWSSENEIGKLWSRLFHLSKKYEVLLRKIHASPHFGYEIHIESEEYRKTREYCIFVGFETTQLDDQPPEMFAKILPRTQYAQVTTKGSNFDPTEHLLREWLPQSPFEQRYRYIIQRYDDRRWKSLEDPRSEIDWLIPIWRRGGP